MALRSELDEKRPGWFWRFFRGVVFSLIVCSAVIAAVSLYVLPPAELPVPEPEPEGPVVIAGIEVSTEPAYSGTEAGTGEAEAETFGPIALSGPALTVNAAAWVPDPEMPLVAVVLDDAAADPLLHPLIFSQPLPLAVGVVAGYDGDRVTAEAARAAGFEVVAQLPLVPQGASGGIGLEFGLPESEASARTDAMMRRLPMAVAATRPLVAPAPPNNSVLDGIFSAIQPHGFAYLDHGVTPDGRSTAEGTGLTGTIAFSRFTIPAGASAADAHAILDAAATDAVKNGGAIVFATAGEELFLALQLWGEGGTGSVARLAPLSAVIGRQTGG